MKNFLEALVVGVIVYIVVAIICYVIGSIPHLDLLRTDNTLIALLFGLLAFLQRWGFKF